VRTTVECFSDDCNLGATYPCLSSFASVAEICQKFNVLGTSSRVTYGLWNVNSIRLWCWNIASDKREVDYWKSEVITFDVNFVFNLSPLSISRWRSRRVWRYQRVIAIGKWKQNRQHNEQKKKYKRTNNDLQNIHIQLKIE